MTAQGSTEAFYDPLTATVSYLVFDPASRRAALIDALLDFDGASGRIGTTSADRMLARVAELALQLDWILETHAHADHLSAADYLRGRTGARVATGARICAVQALFKQLFNLGDEFRADGSQFDHLFADGERFSIGTLEARALPVPGHTPADLAYQIDGAVYVGDTLFMPDVGTARADFPGGDAAVLYASIQTLLALPDDTVLYVGHDYPPPGRAAQWRTTVGAQRRQNIHVGAGVPAAQFVALRRARDVTLAVPALMLPAVQVNIRAGALPPPEQNGARYLKIPLDVLPGFIHNGGSK